MHILPLCFLITIISYRLLVVLQSSNANKFDTTLFFFAFNLRIFIARALSKTYGSFCVKSTNFRKLKKLMYNKNLLKF